MDQALKQRLVGATVLIMLGVILLPMLLSGQPDLQNETARIEVPPKPPELSMETRRFPIGKQPAGQPSAVTEALQQQAVEPPAMPVAEEVDDSSTEEDSGQQPAREPPAQGPDDSAPASAEPGRYLVQVASFSNPGNANNLAAILRENQLPVVMDNVVTSAGRLHRVRVGPFDELEAADASMAQIRALMSDLNPRVVDLRPDENAPVTDPSDPLVRWVVQAGSFADQANAEDLVARLRDEGFAAFLEAVNSASATTYKVKIGPVIERQGAVTLAARLKEKLEIDGLVMSVD